MERFIHRENVANFLDRLRRETDPAGRRTLRSLLAEEMEKFSRSGDNLDLIDRHLSDCKLRIVRQFRIIDDLRQDDRSTMQEQQMLDNLHDIEELLNGHRAVIVEALARKSS
ncbi:MAG: hypothetical protein P4M07_16860 [Xanthobacteraceae bacterium]|nr:hypothetical protein [Xanthobacteraceae bacterium]